MTTPTHAQSKLDFEFYQGVICSLAIVALHDQQTIFDEIVNSVDESELIKIARRNGDMRWSGLTKYGYGRKNKNG